jgi:large subunit ribosomal protein L22
VRNLVVSESRVDEGPTMKRFQPKDRGRAHPILKRTSHLVIAVDEKN